MEGAIVPLSTSTLRRKRRRNALAAGLTEWPQQRALIPTVPVGCVSMATSISWSCKPGHESAATMWDHYYQAVTTEAAAAFWSIYPPMAEQRRIIAFAE
jgi:hypothetical protein